MGTIPPGKANFDEWWCGILALWYFDENAETDGLVLRRLTPELWGEFIKTADGHFTIDAEFYGDEDKDGCQKQDWKNPCITFISELYDWDYHDHVDGTAQYPSTPLLPLIDEFFIDNAPTRDEAEEFRSVINAQIDAYLNSDRLKDREHGIYHPESYYGIERTSESILKDILRASHRQA